MSRRFEQLLEVRHPEFEPKVSKHERTDTLLESILGDMQKGLKNTQQNLSDLNKSADDGIFGVLTHGKEESKGDEVKIKQSWDNLGEYARQSWEEQAENQPPVRNRFGVEEKITGFEYFREIEIEKYKRYAAPANPRTRREIPDSGNQVDFDDYIQGEWDAMDGGDKQRYATFDEYLDMRKRTEQQRGGRS